MTSTDGNYLRITQSIRVEPNTTYTFGCEALGALEEGGRVHMQLLGGTTVTKGMEVSGGWKNFDYTYTTGAQETMLTLRLTADHYVKRLWVDNIYFKTPDGENLIFNSDFEDTYDKKEIDNLKYDLKRAEENNISVCLLLSPHYFPDDWDESVYAEGSMGFLTYNITLPETREYIEEYLRILCEELKGCRAISSICLSNEPVFEAKDCNYDYFQTKFSEWLKKKYGSIEALNKEYGAAGIYKDFSEVIMPTGWDGKVQVFYDYVDFNEEIFTEWHTWMADIVREYFTTTPLHTKTMNLIQSGRDNRGSMMHGANPERFDSFTDWAGNDAGIYETGNGAYTDACFLGKMRWYDFLASTTGKPVYNSEDHVVQNRHTEFNEEYAKQVKASLWQGFVHHNKMSSIWHWTRSYDENSDAYNSILHRPDCIYNAGKVALDANRLSEKLDRITQKKPEVALFYSEASRVNITDNTVSSDPEISQSKVSTVHCSQNLVMYEDLLTLGQSVGFVTEMSVDKMEEYDIIVIGSTPNTTSEAIEALERFSQNGGTVVLVGDDNLKADEYDKEVSCSLSGAVNTTYENFKTDIRPILKKKGLLRVDIVDAKTKEPIEDVEWQFDVDKTGVVVNVFALEGNHDIEIYLDGTKMTNLTDLLTGEKLGGTVSVEEFVPRFLQNPVSRAPKEVDNICVDGRRVTWENDDEAYKYAYIYRINEKNEQEFVTRVSGFSYTAAEDGIIVIKAVDAYENESGGKPVNLSSEEPLSAQISADGKEAFVENTTDKTWAGELAVHLKDSDGKAKSTARISSVVNPNEKLSLYIPFSPREGEYIDIEVVNN